MGVVVVGTESDRPVVELLKQAAPFVRDVTGQTDFGQLATVGRQAVGVVGNDTGPVHLMAAVGAPTLVLYHGGARPQILRPNGPAVHWLQRDSLSDLTAEHVWNWMRENWVGSG